MKIFIGLLILAGLILFIAMPKLKKNYEDGLKEAEDENKVAEMKRIAYNQKHLIPYDVQEVKIYKGHNKIDPFIRNDFILYNLWIKNDEINLVPRFNRFTDDDREKVRFKIKESEIVHFSIEGGIFNEVKVTGTGGGGGGSSLTGAIIGGVVAGGVGAVIGSRKEVQPIEIKSENKRVDDRKTVLYFKENNRVSLIRFELNAYNEFLNYFPQKEKQFINS